MVFSRFLLVLLACLPFVARAADSSPPFSLVAPAAWVSPLDETGLAQGTDKTFGTEYLLVDKQVNVAEQSSFSHITYRITADTGLQRGSQITIDYDPAYESIDWHFLHLIRDGKVLDRFKPEAIKIIQQERDLDRHMYNGQLTALIMVDDVRVGDVIDYATTRHGANPIFNGAYLDAFYAGWIAPVRHQRVRLLAPAGRSFHVKIHQPDTFALKETTTTSSGVTEHVWEARDIRPLAIDDDQPSWFNPLPFIQVSEYSNWSEVVNWALPLYSVDEPLTPEMKTKLDELLTGAVTSEEKITAVLDFVQRDIRYLGIEMGPRSHQPNPASEVFARRFGDCKDKSRLFCTLLHAVGIDAYPALVHSTLKQTVRDWIASPYAFDHVIARVSVHGQTWWLDPTLSYQRGVLKKRSELNYSPALVIAPGQSDLVSTQISSGFAVMPGTPSGLSSSNIPTEAEITQEMISHFPPLPTGQHGIFTTQTTGFSPASDQSKYAPPNETFVRVFEAFDLSATDGPHRLDVVTTYEGRSADTMRAYLANTSRDEVEKNLLNFYARLYPAITTSQKAQWQDQESENKIIIEESYAIPQVWKSARHGNAMEATFSPMILQDYTARPESPKRTTPLRVRYPVNIDVTTIVKLHKPWDLAIPETWIKHDAFSYHQSITAQKNTVTMSFQWRSKRDSVSAADTAAYATKLEEVRNRAGYFLSFDPVLDKTFEHYLINWSLILWMLGVLIGAFFVSIWFGKAKTTAPLPGEPPLMAGFKPASEPIGGWLVLVAIGVTIRPFMTFGMFFYTYTKFFDRRVWINATLDAHPLLGPTVLMEAVCSLFLAFLSITGLVLFFQKRRGFVKLIIFHLFLTAVYYVTDVILVHVITPSRSSDADVRLIFSASIAVVWALYFIFSKRVKKTFTR